MANRVWDLDFLKLMMRKVLQKSEQKEIRIQRRFALEDMFPELGPNPKYSSKYPSVVKKTVKKFAVDAAKARTRALTARINAATTEDDLKHLLFTVDPKIAAESSFFRRGNTQMDVHWPTMMNRAGYLEPASRIARAASRAFLSPHTELGRRRLLREFEKLTAPKQNHPRNNRRNHPRNAQPNRAAPPRNTRGRQPYNAPPRPPSIGNAVPFNVLMGKGLPRRTLQEKINASKVHPAVWH